MKLDETETLTDSIVLGIKLAIKRLIEKTQKEDGELVISVNGKVTRVKARDLKLAGDGFVYPTTDLASTNN